MSVDETDLEIIDRLKEDGRASLRELADDLDLSPSTVSNRFHRLKEEGILKGFQPKLDYEELGFELTAVIDVRLNSAGEETVSEISDRDETMSEFVVTGETDIVLICKFVDREHMYEFLGDLQQEDGVEDTETNVALECVQEYGCVDLWEGLEG
ncbi:MAG: Lrp/AsnC family transcriptional regulator [Candidatus Nanohaloarchaea archaeon]